MRTLSILAILALGSASAVAAQSTDSDDQTVTFEVQAISQASFAAGPTLTITTAVPGSAPTAVTGTSSWAVTTNQTNQKITAELDSDMPTGVTLKVTLEEPTGATSVPSVTLSSSAADVVTGIATLNESGLAMSYELSATSAAGVVAQDTRTVTYTFTTGP